MIGLRRGDVRLFEHNKEWKIEGERTVNELRKILGSDAVDIQHVGSTSIKSIKAKPIIDIAVGTDDFNRILSHEAELLKAGYHSVPTTIWAVHSCFLPAAVTMRAAICRRTLSML